MANVKIEQIIKTSADWASETTPLAINQIGYEIKTDGSYSIRHGDGVSLFYSLPDMLESRYLQHYEDDAWGRDTSQANGYTTTEKKDTGVGGQFGVTDSGAPAISCTMADGSMSMVATYADEAGDVKAQITARDLNNVGSRILLKDDGKAYYKASASDNTTTSDNELATSGSLNGKLGTINTTLAVLSSRIPAAPTDGDLYMLTAKSDPAGSEPVYAWQPVA